MHQKKNKKSKICLYCSHEIKLFNNDEQFSWDIHKQEDYHVRTRQKGKKKMSVKEDTNMHIQTMKNLFLSNAHLEEWATELVHLADEQLANQERNEQVKKAVHDVFSKVYTGKFNIILFGSRLTGLTTKNTGDLDIFLDTIDETNISLIDNPERENWALRKIAEYMTISDSSNWANVVSVLTCRTPILKTLHFNTKMQCDITVRNSLGIINTQLMTMYIKNIPKLRPLLLIIREWSSQCGFVKDINNYALSMIVLFYLQQEKYAPAVSELDFYYTGPKKIINGYECINYDNVQYEWNAMKSTQDVSLKNLLIGFFEYYSTFDFDKMVICPLLGEPVLKRLFNENGKKLPKEMYFYVQKLKQHGEQFQMNKKGICLQDPLDLAHNLTKSSKEQCLYSFIDMCDSAKRALQALS